MSNGAGTVGGRGWQVQTERTDTGVVNEPKSRPPVFKGSADAGRAMGRREAEAGGEAGRSKRRVKQLRRRNGGSRHATLVHIF
jgi:hypothetical protein